MNEQNKALDIVREVIHEQKYRITDQRCNDAVNRLISNPDAVIAWGQICKKQPKKNHVDDGFYFAVTVIVDAAIAAWLPKSIKKTAKEIQTAAKKAAEHARCLAELIKDNYSLQTITLTDCLHSKVQASLDRMLAGVVCGSEKGKGLVFAPDVEAHITDDSGLTTKDAYIILRHELNTPEALFDTLKNFADQAEETNKLLPLSNSPNVESFDQQRLCVSICSTLNYVYGQPFTGIAAALTGAVFDKDIDNESAKKWWQRDPARKLPWGQFLRKNT